MKKKTIEIISRRLIRLASASLSGTSQKTYYQKDLRGLRHRLKQK